MESLVDGSVVLVAANVGDVARGPNQRRGLRCHLDGPYRIDVKPAMHAGCNTVEIDVANAWMNRLISEAAGPTGELFEPVTGVYALMRTYVAPA